MKFKDVKAYIFTAMLFLQALCYAHVKLPKLISNGMVLQHSQNIKIWGWAAPGEKVNMVFASKNYSAKTAATGEWVINLPPQKAGGPYDLTITASNKIVVNDVLFGDVWLCSGQSNMEMTMSSLLDTYPEETTATNNEIRQFLVPDVYNFKNKQTDLNSGSWKAVTPQTIDEFSGVAYFFASQVYKKHNVPIGIINASVGGSPAQAWISEAGLKKFPVYFDELQKFKDDKHIATIEDGDKLASKTWNAELNKKDAGLKNNWKAAAFDDSSWSEMKIPGVWASTPLGSINGAVWLRKTINVPAAMVSMPTHLLLGRITDVDSVYVNDVFVGTTTNKYPNRKYAIAGGILKPGKNTIAIRVISHAGGGGFVLDKQYRLVAGSESLSLEGLWKYSTGAVMPARKPQTFVRWKPTGLYNAMISPLQNYTIKGALWYQGESNTGKPEEYLNLMKTLITDWRTGFNQDIPFLYVQLPGYMEEKPEPGESNWATLRNEQSKILAVTNTAMAVTIDLGEWNDVHPVNKKDVGIRLALQAEKLVYGNTAIVASGPVAATVRKQNGKLIITFINTGGGLIAKDNKALHYFAIAGKDQKYVWAAAKITGLNEVTVWNDSVKSPLRVSYAWADNPATANLYNKEGLPAMPFKLQLK